VHCVQRRETDKSGAVSQKFQTQQKALRLAFAAQAIQIAKCAKGRDGKQKALHCGCQCLPDEVQNFGHFLFLMISPKGIQSTAG
jgi:hypothetical protein